MRDAEPERIADPSVSRMLCVECRHVGEPDTLLEGSDLLELLAWCCLGVPGLLYCWWRHFTRLKACPLCHGPVLMRESNAAAARRGPQAARSLGPRVVSARASHFSWWAPLRTPRERMRIGGCAIAVGVCAGLALSLVGPDSIPSTGLIALIAASVVGTTRLAQRMRRAADLHDRSAACQAWEEGGRRLHIELL